MLVLNSVVGICAVILFIAVLTFSLHKQRIRYRKRRQAVGLCWLQCLRALLACVQRHRGLTTGYLNGSTGLKNEIESLQQEATQNIRDIVAIDPWMESNDRWMAIIQHWARIAGRFEKNSANNNLDQHQALIQNILYLIDDMAQDHDLLLLRSRDNKPLHLSWRELLSAAEYIGQARALGMGVTAAAHCNSVSRIKLKYLCRKITENTARVWSEIKPLKDSEKKVEAILTCISQQIINEKPSISSADYFLLASLALDSLHEQYDNIIEELKDHS
jgi:hypothetical protein